MGTEAANAAGHDDAVIVLHPLFIPGTSDRRKIKPAPEYAAQGGKYFTDFVLVARAHRQHPSESSITGGERNDSCREYAGDVRSPEFELNGQVNGGTERKSFLTQFQEAGRTVEPLGDLALRVTKRSIAERLPAYHLPGSDPLRRWGPGATCERIVIFDDGCDRRPADLGCR